MGAGERGGDAGTEDDATGDGGAAPEGAAAGKASGGKAVAGKASGGAGDRAARRAARIAARKTTGARAGGRGDADDADGAEGGGGAEAGGSGRASAEALPARIGKDGRAAARMARLRRRRMAKRRAGAQTQVRARGADSGKVGPRRGRGAVSAAPRPAIVVEMSDPEVERRMRRRAIWSAVGLWTGFALAVVAPTIATGWYLFERAADQYASRTSFSVRSLDGSLPSPVMDLFGAATDTTAGDSQMLFEFLQSQPLVAEMQAQVDLRAIWNRPEADWLFALGEAPSIEDLTTFWNRAVSVAYDAGGGIIHVEVRAFRPEDAHAVAVAVAAESERLINALSTGARSDAVRFAEVDLAAAEDRVRAARLALQAFRSSQGTADVTGDITQEMGLIAGLRAQRAELQADYDSRRGLLGADSPVLTALARRIAGLDVQIAEAEARIADVDGGTAADGAATGRMRSTLAEAAGEQERLQVELELAVNMYTAAQAGLEGARAEARRAQRYLASHIAPTLPEAAEYPRRTMWTAAVFGVALVLWSIALLVVSSIRDRT